MQTKRLTWGLLALSTPFSLLAQELPDLGSTRPVTSGSAFNPAISVILDGRYYRDSVDGEGTEIVGEALGFHGHHEEGHEHGGVSPGFSLAETEVALTASVDNYLDAYLGLAVTEHGIEIEEAYGLTRALPAGLQLKMGKFFSGIGYINSQHAHQWDFVDNALNYQLIFGDHGLNDTGLQLTWAPGWGTYTVFGVEALQGSNEAFANHIGEVAHEFVAGGLSTQDGPRLFTAFAKWAPDLGADHALQGGLSWGRASLHQEQHAHDGEVNFLEGDSWFAGTDWVYKYDTGRPYGEGAFRLQAEYLYRVKDLTVAAKEQVEGPAVGAERVFTQDGLYVQGVYGIAPRWTAGLRYDVVGLANERDSGTATDDFDSSSRIAAAVSFKPSEFSLVRLQYSQNSIMVGEAEREKFNQVWLQYQLALGAHGAHRF